MANELTPKRDPSHMFSVTVPLDLIGSGDYREALANMTRGMVAMARLHGGNFVCDDPNVSLYEVPATQTWKYVVGSNMDIIRGWQKQNPGNGAQAVSTGEARWPMIGHQNVLPGDVLFLQHWRDGEYWRHVEKEIVRALVNNREHIEHCPGYAS